MLLPMTPRTKKTAAALSGALVLASGAYALGSQAGDGSALAGSKPNADARPPATASAPVPATAASAAARARRSPTPPSSSASPRTSSSPP